MPRVAEHLVGSAALDDLAVGHHEDAVGAVGGDAQIVGDEHEARARLALQGVEMIEDLPLHGHVEGAGGLVGEDERRSRDDRERDEHALAESAGELVRVLGGAQLGVRDAGAAERDDRLATGLVAVGQPVDAQHLGDLRADAHDRVEADHRVLRHEADGAAAHGAQRAVVGGEQVGAVEQHPPGGHAPAPGEQPQQGVHGGRLARPRLADDREGLAAGEGERDVAHGDDRPAAGGVLDAQAVDLQQRGGHPHPSPSRSSARETRFAASTVRAITRPGSVVSHQEVRRKSRPSETSEPHSGVGGCAP